MVVQSSDSEDDFEFLEEEGGIKVDGIYIPPPPQPYFALEEKGPRLIITKITNHFFKSYANKIALGPFHKCFNSIVGPNGSGKSNVIDSMLFVFGYRASKIRSKKLSVLIHNSEGFKNVPSCTVSVHFAQIIDKEGDDYDIVPNSEFIVSRTANKDNSSYFTINNKKAQFKDVAVLLKKHGIDLTHNRFLILQGEVEQIAMMQPKGNENEHGMLEYLEDIIGTGRYKVPIAKLENRVEHLSNLRTDKINRLRLVQEELDVLKEPMQEALGYLKLENNIAKTKNMAYQYNIFILRTEMKEFDEKKAEIDEKAGKVNDELNEVSAELSAKKEEFKEETKKFDQLEKRKDAMKEAYKAANNRHTQITAELKETNKQRHKAKDSLAAETKKLEKLKRVPDEVEKEIKEYEENLTKLEPQRIKIEEEKVKFLASIKEVTKELQAKKEVIQKDLAEKQSIVNTTKETYTLAEVELKNYTSSQDSQKQKHEDAKTKLAAVTEKINQYTHELKKLSTEIPHKEKELKASNTELPNVRQQEATLIEKLRKDFSKLEEVKVAMNASRGRGRVLDALMQQKREGNCPDLYGRLGDLGAIDPKYDVAISTACGPLDHLVVDSTDTAKWCIQFLKRNNIGRAAIIALDSQQNLLKYCNTPIPTPENVPRLFDLIKVADDRYKPAFYYGLRDTLVAEDLEQATRIAYGHKRYRVVTLAGQLIEMTGTMSGGGSRVLKGRMGRSIVTEVDPREMKKLEEEVQQQEVVLQQLRNKQQILNNKLTILSPEINEMKIAQRKMNLEMDSLRTQKTTLQEQLKELDANVKRISIDPAKLAALTKSMEERKQVYDEALQAAEVVEKKVRAITREIEEKSQVKAIDKKLKEMVSNIDKLKSEINKMKVSLSTNERNVSNSEEKIATLQQDIKDAESKLQQMSDDRNEIEKDGEKLLACIEEIVAKIEEGTSEFAGLKEKISQLTKRENEIKSLKIEWDQKKNAINEKIGSFQGQINGFKAKIKELKLQEIPDEDPEELKEIPDEELDQLNDENLMKQLRAMEAELKSCKPNLSAIEDYKKKMSVYSVRAKELDEVSDKRAKMREYFDMLRARRKQEFMSGYNVIKMKLKEMYQMITIGGDADFELIDSFDPFSEGVQFRVRPPKKTWKTISNLSGGEKTLSSLALVFALHYYKPSPLYVMDEIDAALDFKNVSIVGNYIKERTKDAQFIIISLRSNMFELADYLIGIYKTFNCTKTVMINPRLFDKEKRPFLPIAAVDDDNQKDSVQMDDNNEEDATLTNKHNEVESRPAAPSGNTEANNYTQKSSSDLFSTDSQQSEVQDATVHSTTDNLSQADGTEEDGFLSQSYSINVIRDSQDS